MVMMYLNHVGVSRAHMNEMNEIYVVVSLNPPSQTLSATSLHIRLCSRGYHCSH